MPFLNLKTNELDFTFAIIISGVILVSLAGFLLLMMHLYLQKTLKHKSQITALKTDQNKELLRSAIQTQENERKRIGNNIHDDIGPMLSALKLQISQIKSENNLNAKNIKESKKTIDDIISTVRNVSRDLVPSVLFELGLVESLDYILKRLKKLTDAEVIYVNTADLSNITKPQSLAIYRIIQESLNNVLKHADATEIKVNVSEDKDVLQITVADNGKGFNKETVHNGLGLKNIEARIETFNGEFECNSQEGFGTTITTSMKIQYEN